MKRIERGWKKREATKEEKGRGISLGGQCQDRPIVLSLHRYFNKSILIGYIINNNLIKNPKYSIVSFLLIFLSPLRKRGRKLASSCSPAEQEKKTSTRHDGDIKKELLRVVFGDRNLHNTSMIGHSFH